MSAKPILIVESPSKAKTISKYLGGKYEVMACVGHIKDLPKTDLGVDVDNDFAITEEVLDDKKPFMKELRKLAKQTDQIVVATDPDREGEAIAAILQVKWIQRKFLASYLQKSPKKVLKKA